MESENSITISEFFVIALYTGLPVYIVGAFLQIVFFYLLGLHQNHSFITSVLFIVSTFILSLLLAIILWLILPFYEEKYFMMFGAINTPALISEIIMISLSLIVFKYFRNSPKLVI